MLAGHSPWRYLADHFDMSMAHNASEIERLKAEIHQEELIK
jgi:hypothetical protein